MMLNPEQYAALLVDSAVKEQALIEIAKVEPKTMSGNDLYAAWKRMKELAEEGLRLAHGSD